MLKNSNLIGGWDTVKPAVFRVFSGTVPKCRSNEISLTLSGRVLILTVVNYFSYFPISLHHTVLKNSPSTGGWDNFLNVVSFEYLVVQYLSLLVRISLLRVVICILIFPHPMPFTRSAERQSFDWWLTCLKTCLVRIVSGTKPKCQSNNMIESNGQNFLMKSCLFLIFSDTYSSCTLLNTSHLTVSILSNFFPIPCPSRTVLYNRHEEHPFDSWLIYWKNTVTCFEYLAVLHVSVGAMNIIDSRRQNF